MNINAEAELYNALMGGNNDYIIVIGDSLMASSVSRGLAHHPNVNLAIQGQTLLQIADPSGQQMLDLTQVCSLCAPRGIIFSGGSNDANLLYNGSESWTDFNNALGALFSAVRSKVVDSKIICVIPNAIANATLAPTFAQIQSYYASHLAGTSIAYSTLSYEGLCSGSPPVGNAGYFYDGMTHYNQAGWDLVKGAVDAVASGLGW